MNKASIRLSFLIVMSLNFFANAQDPKTVEAKTHGISMHGDLKYSPDFKNFSYVNPAAPKGGKIKFSVIGTFNSLNPFVVKGSPPPGLSLYSEPLVFDSLMRRSGDEPFSLYGLIAEFVHMAPDRSSITFYVNPKAKWADGHPITADDIIFTQKILKEKGPANLQLYYSKVAKVEKTSDLGVKFTFKTLPEGGYDLEAPLLLALMTILPKHILEGRDFEKITMDPILGSGPYKVAEVKPGHSIRYQRRPDYWAADLPVNRGRYNFDEVHFEYYRNAQVEFEAFKAGQFDIHAENDPSIWSKDYNFPAAKDGRVIKIEYEHARPVGMKAFIFNTRRELFSDIRVRQALNYAFEFERYNKAFLQNAYTRTESYFANTFLASKGIPEGEELALLLPYKNVLPPELFQKEFHLPVSSDQADVRENLKIATALLKEAGWQMHNGTLIHQKTKKPFHFEILLYKAQDEKLALAFARNLKHLGITVKIRTVDTAQFENRMGHFDFDMTVWFWGHTMSPGTEQKFYWGSQGVNEPYSRNSPGINSQAIDGLCENVANAKDYEQLKIAVHALDRALLWGYYTVPTFHHNKNFLAHSDKLSHPEIDPSVGIYFSSWWSKEASRRPEP